MSFNRELLIDRIKELSQAKSISATKALQESGAGKDFIANLKKGQAPSIEKIAIVADYFNVSVDYLLGKTSQKEKDTISEDDVKVALFGGEKDVPDEVWQEVKDFAAYAKAKYGKKK